MVSTPTDEGKMLSAGSQGVYWQTNHWINPSRCSRLAEPLICTCTNTMCYLHVWYLLIFSCMIFNWWSPATLLIDAIGAKEEVFVRSMWFAVCYLEVVAFSFEEEYETLVVDYFGKCINMLRWMCFRIFDPIISQFLVLSHEGNDQPAGYIFLASAFFAVSSIDAFANPVVYSVEPFYQYASLNVL